MKKFIIGIVAAIAFTFSVSTAKAQLGNPTVVFKTAGLTTGQGNILTNGVSVTNTYTPSGKDVALQFTLQANAASTSNLVATVAESVDGTTYATKHTLRVAASGTTQVTFVTNLTVNAVQKLRFIVTSDDDDGPVITNATIKAASR